MLLEHRQCRNGISYCWKGSFPSELVKHRVTSPVWRDVGVVLPEGRGKDAVTHAGSFATFHSMDSIFLGAHESFSLLGGLHVPAMR